MKEENKYRAWGPVHAPEDLDLLRTYDWRLTLCKAPLPPVVPVAAFPQTELRQMADAAELNIVLEVPSKIAKRTANQLWLAKVVRMAGYRVLVRFLGAEAGDGRDFWMGLFCQDVHGVGYAARHGLPLVPPAFLSAKDREDVVRAGGDEEAYWTKHFLPILAAQKSLPLAWEEAAAKALDPALHGFTVGLRLEFLDRNYTHHVRVGQVAEVVGPRIRIKFSSTDLEGHHRSKENVLSENYWVSVHSPFIFPVGWALAHGCVLKANEQYRKHSESVQKDGAYAATDARPELFDYQPLSEKVVEETESERGWEVGMRLEAMDIVSHSHIHVASVRRILPDHWLEIQIDDEPADDVFVMHSRSPYLFPVGFCERHDIPLKPPENMGISRFSWPEYLRQVDAEAAPEHLFDCDDPRYDSSAFKEGAVLEAVEVKSGGCELSPAYVLRRLGTRLLHIDFLRHDDKAWGEEFQAFHDFRSPDLRPLGWAEMVGHPLWHPNPNIGDLRKASPEVLHSTNVFGPNAKGS